MLDATLKIIGESQTKADGSIIDRAKERLAGIRNLYRGGLVFGLSYIAYTAV